MRATEPKPAPKGESVVFSGVPVKSDPEAKLILDLIAAMDATKPPDPSPIHPTVRKIADELHKAHRMGVLPDSEEDRRQLARAILMFDATVEGGSTTKRGWIGRVIVTA